MPIVDGAVGTKRSDGTGWHHGGASGGSGRVDKGGCRGGHHAGGAHGRVHWHAAGRWARNYKWAHGLDHHEVDELAASRHLKALSAVDGATADVELLDASTAEVVCFNIGLAAKLGGHSGPGRRIGDVEPGNWS